MQSVSCLNAIDYLSKLNYCPPEVCCRLEPLLFARTVELAVDQLLPFDRFRTLTGAARRPPAASSVSNERARFAGGERPIRKGKQGFFLLSPRALKELMIFGPFYHQFV